MFYEGTELRQSLHNDHLKYVPDLHRLSKRFQRGIATLQVICFVSFIVSPISLCYLCKGCRPNSSSDSSPACYPIVSGIEQA